MDRLLDLMDEINDARVELEELNECGDLEERLEAAMKLEDLEAEFTRESLRETGEYDEL